MAIEFNANEKTVILEALDMALASNKRMQNSKPKFAQVFQSIEADLTALKTRITQDKTAK